MTEEDSLDSIENTEWLDLNDALHIGKVLNYLHLSTDNQFPFKNFDDEDGNYILAGLEDLSSILRSSKIESSVVSDIERTKNEFIEANITDDQDEDQIYLSDREYANLGRAVSTWQNIISEELASIETIRIENKGLFDIKKARDHPDKLFHDSTLWSELPNQTQSDLAEACQTLAFQCSTSTVFLSLRAVEERLGAWYETETDRDIEDRTFGQVLTELDDHYSDTERPPILSHLDFLKERRNQIAHPERSPNEQEAESTLIMVRETITSIQNQLEE